jgi:alpha-beta hydrolase superfamily lysophospholipase
MKKPLLITFLALAAIALAAAGLLAALGTLGSSVDDPAVAPCRRPPKTVGIPRTVLDHREAVVRFTCNKARLSGTLYLPLRPGRHPAVVWVHGSGEQARLSYGPLVASYVEDGIAFFSYDKRGVAESEGACCPDEHGHFNLVTADAVGAVEAVRSMSAVDRVQVGFVGASAAGWIAPRAAEESKHVAFIALASPGVLRHSLVARFEHEAAEGANTAQLERELPSWKPSGFDPTPYLERLDVPTLWLFGGADLNVPPLQSVAKLRAIKHERGKDWTIVVFPGAGHGLFDEPPTDRRAAPTAEKWVRDHVNNPY